MIIPAGIGASAAAKADRADRKLARAMLERDLKSWERWVKIANIEPM